MKKVMFSDKYGLTTAVFEGRKTQARMLEGNRMTEYDIDAYMRGYHDVAYALSPLKIGEIVAIAQSYHDAGFPPTEDNLIYHRWCDEAGWTNKMFVKGRLMPHQIKITNIRVERLQDISEDDCLKEGIEKCKIPLCIKHYFIRNCGDCASSPREVFSELIDKVSGKGTWDSNPWVFVYEFELVK